MGVKPIFVYITGPYEATNPTAKAHNIQNLSLVCRRVLVTGHIPICPVLSAMDWKKDPRLAKEDLWWVEQYFKPLMKKCSAFCYVRSPAGYQPERIDLEKAAWKEVGNGKFILSDFILDYLLNINKDAILGTR